MKEINDSALITTNCATNDKNKRLGSIWSKTQENGNFGQNLGYFQKNIGAENTNLAIVGTNERHHLLALRRYVLMLVCPFLVEQKDRPYLVFCQYFHQVRTV